MCYPPPLASQYWIINILCTPGRYPWPWPKPLVPTRPIAPPASGIPRPHPFSLPPHPISLIPRPLPFLSTPSSPAHSGFPLHLPGAHVRAPAANASSVGGAAGRLCAGALSGADEGEGLLAVSAHARAAAVLGSAWHGRLFPGSGWAAGLGRPWRGAQQHHVPALNQLLEPGVLCLHGGPGHPGGVGCLLRLRGEQV